MLAGKGLQSLQHPFGALAQGLLKGYVEGLYDVAEVLCLLPELALGVR